MKRFLSAALALSLLGATAAQADSFYGPRGGHYERYDRHDYDRDRDHYRHHDNSGALIAAGVGLFALTAILASQNNERERVYVRDDRYAPPPPPPPYYGPRDGYYYGR